MGNSLVAAGAAAGTQRDRSTPATRAQRAVEPAAATAPAAALAACTRAGGHPHTAGHTSAAHRSSLADGHTACRLSAAADAAPPASLSSGGGASPDALATRRRSAMAHLDPDLCRFVYGMRRRVAAVCVQTTMLACGCVVMWWRAVGYMSRGCVSTFDNKCSLCCHSPSLSYRRPARRRDKDKIRALPSSFRIPHSMLQPPRGTKFVPGTKNKNQACAPGFECLGLATLIEAGIVRAPAAAADAALAVLTQPDGLRLECLTHARCPAPSTRAHSCTTRSTRTLHTSRASPN